MTERFETENEYGRGAVLSWASIIDPLTREQAERTSRSPILAGHLALMPDAHLGSGATVGSVLVTEGGIIPAAVGVDIGCGMVAVKTSLKRESTITKRDEHLILGFVRDGIPNGVGQNHKAPTGAARRWFEVAGFAPGLDSPGLQARAMNQFGTLGSGNHFAEFSTDDDGYVWMVVHSGSRGTGLALAEHHIAIAQGTCPVPVEDPNLAFLQEGTAEFDAYIADMQWAQKYALAQRNAMMDVLVDALYEVLMRDVDMDERINCHHNYAVPFDLEGKSVWLTRKGAIDASVGKLGVIPGSMGTDSFIVAGCGNVDSYLSAPHGAGRNFSRGTARRTLSLDEFVASMGGRTWGDRDAMALLDESPLAYKDISQVMFDARDLVTPVARLTSFINFKAADGRRR